MTAVSVAAHRLAIAKPWTPGNRGYMSLASRTIYTSTSDTHTSKPISVGSFLTASTNSHILAVDGEDTLSYWVAQIFDAQRRSRTFQYVTAAELAAASFGMLCIPAAACDWEIEEDALVTPLTDAMASGLYYCDINITVPTAAQIAKGNLMPFTGPVHVTKLDSDTANTTAGSLTFRIKGISPRNTQAYSATAGASPRVFIVEPRDKTYVD